MKKYITKFEETPRFNTQTCMSMQDNIFESYTETDNFKIEYAIGFSYADGTEVVQGDVYITFDGTVYAVEQIYGTSFENKLIQKLADVPTLSGSHWFYKKLGTINENPELLTNPVTLKEIQIEEFEKIKKQYNL